MTRSKINAGRTAAIFKYNSTQVLKLYRNTFPKEAIEKEFQIGLYLNRLGIEAPKTYATRDYEGSKGIVFEYIPGPSMLQHLAKKPWKLFSGAVLMARLHRNMHTTPIPAGSEIPMLNKSLADKISKVALLNATEKASIISHLSSLKQGSVICHGDFHPDNIIMSKGGLVTVDWLTATIGNPMADVAQTWLLLTMGTLPENKTVFEILLAKYLREIFCSCYVSEYRRLSNFDSNEFEAWKLPVAAARLLENVSGQENQNLLKFIKRRLQKCI